MHAYAARTARGCTSKTCGDHAHAILHAASACRVFFCRHHTRLPLLASTMAKVSSVCTPENSQPAQYYRFSLGVKVVTGERHTCSHTKITLQARAIIARPTRLVGTQPPRIHARSEQRTRCRAVVCRSVSLETHR